MNKLGFVLILCLVSLGACTYGSSKRVQELVAPVSDSNIEETAPVGDITGDGLFDQSDVQCYIDDFIADEATGCGTVPVSEADFNCNDQLDINDVDAAIYLANTQKLPEGLDENADGIPDCKQ